MSRGHGHTGFDTSHPRPSPIFFFISPLKKNDLFCGYCESNFHFSSVYNVAFLAFLESNYCHSHSVKKKEAPATWCCILLHLQTWQRRRTKRSTEWKGNTGEGDALVRLWRQHESYKTRHNGTRSLDLFLRWSHAWSPECLSGLVFAESPLWNCYYTQQVCMSCSDE